MERVSEGKKDRGTENALVMSELLGSHIPGEFTSLEAALGLKLRNRLGNDNLLRVQFFGSFF